MTANTPTEAEMPLNTDDIKQNGKGTMGTTGGDGEEGKIVSRRAGKPRIRTRKMSRSIRGPELVGKILPTLEETPLESREALFRQKIELCCTVFDYYDIENYLEDKTIKLRTLEELLVYTRPDSDVLFSGETLSSIISMLRINLLRPPDLPLSTDEEVFGIADEDENILELIWQNLQPIYQLFLNIIVHKNLDINLSKKYLTLEFIGRFTELFDRDDAREREYVKTLLHRIYGRFLSFRGTIRKIMSHQFFDVIHENRCNRGIAEMLEFLGSIINGFATPLKSEHIQFLKISLIPLLRPQFLPNYALELMYCLTQFVEKDPQTAILILKGLRRYWPTTSTSKQLIFLQLLEESVSLAAEADIDQRDFILTLIDLTTNIICLGLSCPAFVTLERTCELWTSEYLCQKLLLNPEFAFDKILVRVYRDLVKANRLAWSPPAKFLTANILSMYQELDKDKFLDLEQKEEEKRLDGLTRHEIHQLVWSSLIQQAVELGIDVNNPGEEEGQNIENINMMTTAMDADDDDKKKIDTVVSDES